jgi:hypothetical protein
MAIHVDFACNNPDNGNPVGKFHMMQVRAGDIDMEFEGPCYQSDGIRFNSDRGTTRVGRIKVNALSYKSWVGNWCWDSITVSLKDALRIINYVGRQTKQGWHMSCGSEILFDAFDKRHAITEEEWHAENEATTKEETEA